MTSSTRWCYDNSLTVIAISSKSLTDVCVDTGTMKELSDVKCAIDMGKSQRLPIWHREHSADSERNSAKFCVRVTDMCSHGERSARLENIGLFWEYSGPREAKLIVRSTHAPYLAERTYLIDRYVTWHLSMVRWLTNPSHQAAWLGMYWVTSCGPQNVHSPWGLRVYSTTRWLLLMVGETVYKMLGRRWRPLRTSGWWRLFQMLCRQNRFITPL